MNKSKLFKVLIVSVVLIAGATELAYAAGPANPPWSECYWFTYPVGPGGIFEINHYLHYVGYDARVYGNLTADWVRRTMYKDAVFAIVAEGYPGRVMCKNGMTQISAKIVPSEDFNYSLEAAFANTTDKLKWCRIIYWGSCESARYSSKYGDLNDYSVTLGADASVGFKGIIDNDCATTFERRVFDLLTYNGGYYLYSALWHAKEYTKKRHRKYGGVDTYEIRGNYTEKILPVGYGDF